VDALPGPRRDLLPPIAEAAGGRGRDGEEQALFRADDRAFRVQPHQTGRLAPDVAGGRFGDGRQKITPGAWERIHGLRLRFVYRRGSPSLLVADNVRLTKRGRAAANIGRRQGAAFTRLTGRTTVPLFILVPEVTVRKRLDIDGAAQKWIAALPQLVVQHWQSAA
jgi:hypothetical protein